MRCKMKKMTKRGPRLRQIKPGTIFRDNISIKKGRRRNSRLDRRGTK